MIRNERPVMIVYYLVFALLMSDGQRPPTLAVSFDTEAECNAEGHARAAEILSNMDVQRALWMCLPADFSQDAPKGPSA
jgi:hypothetical protein